MCKSFNLLKVVINKPYKCIIVRFIYQYKYIGFLFNCFKNHFSFPTAFVGNIGTEFITTNNNGGCCTSDNVYHECCGYSSVFDPSFTISQCATLCLNDGQCKGYSIHLIKTPISVEFCIIYTTSSSCSNQCGTVMGMYSYAVGSLNQNANCPANCQTLNSTISCTVQNEGCFIKATGKCNNCPK